MPTIIRLLRNGVLLGDAKAENAKVTDGINQSGTWSATIPSNSYVAELIQDGDIVDITYDGTSLMIGRVSKIDRAYINGKSVAISGYNYLDDIYKAVDPFHNCEDEPIIYPIARILRHYGWTLNDISTMENPFTQFTIDIRGESTSAAQITKLLQANRLTNFRKDGETGIQIGRFNQYEGFLFTDPSPVLKTPSETNGIITGLKVTEDSQNIISAMYMRGGKYSASAGVKTDLTLAPIIANDAMAEFLTDFPIEMPIPYYDYRVRNTNLPAPGGVKVVDHLNFVGGTGYSTNLRAIGDANSTAAAITNRVCSFLIKPLHGSLKSLKFWGTIQNGDNFAGLRVFLVRMDMNVDTYPLADVGSVWNNRDTDPRFVWGEYIDYTTWVGEHYYQWVDGEISVEAGEAFSLVFLVDEVVDQNFLSFLLHDWNTWYTQTVDGNIALCATIDGTSGWNTNNRYGLVHEVQSYPENGVQRVISEQQQSYTPREDDQVPSSADILAAAQALYERTIATLLDGENPTKSYSMQSIVGLHFPKIGEKVNVRAQDRTARRDRVSHQLIPVVRSIDAQFMVQSYNLSLQNSKIDASFSIVEGDGITNLDRFKFTSLYDQTKPEKNKTDEPVINAFFRHYPTVLVAVPLSGVADTILSNGLPAKTITYDSSLLTPPVNPALAGYFATLLYQAAYPYPDPLTFLNVPNSDILIEEVTRINQFGDVAEYKISTRQGWEDTYSMTVYFFLQWEF